MVNHVPIALEPLHLSTVSKFGLAIISKFSPPPHAAGFWLLTTSKRIVVVASSFYMLVYVYSKPNEWLTMFPLL